MTITIKNDIIPECSVKCCSKWRKIELSNRDMKKLQSEWRFIKGKTAQNKEIIK